MLLHQIGPLRAWIKSDEKYNIQMHEPDITDCNAKWMSTFWIKITIQFDFDQTIVKLFIVSGVM